MKTRQEVAKFIEQQFKFRDESLPKKGDPNNNAEHATPHHYGRMEARELLDFICEGGPRGVDERIASKEDV